MKKLLALFCTFLITSSAFAQSGSTDLSDLIEKCSPAVFKIITYDADGNEYSIGTGFFISSSGIGLSNYHVFQGAAKARIKTSDNKTYSIDNVIAWSKESDIMKFSIKNESNEVFPFLKMNSVLPRVGEKIFIIGSPLGLEKSVSDGIVANVHLDDKMGETIQITAPISKGNSGSPLMNMNGEAIGIVTYYLENGQNLNFAISVKNLNILAPINALKFPEEENASTKTAGSVSNNGGASNGESSGSNSTGADYYLNSRVVFCTAIDTSNGQPLKAAAKFKLSSTKGSNIYVWLSAGGNKLATNQILVKVYKKKGKSYNDLCDSQAFSITDSWPDAYFKYTFTSSGSYLFRLYTKSEVPIKDGYVNIKYKK